MNVPVCLVAAAAAVTTPALQEFYPAGKINFVSKAFVAASNPRRDLKFIHVTKTGGTLIEEQGKLYQKLWGQYDAQYHWKSSFVRTDWHAPFIESPAWLATKYDWFMVVRNPYDRIISEVYCKYGGGRVGVNKAAFNRYVTRSILGYTSKKFNSGKKSGHFVPQYLYLRPSAKIWVIKFERLVPEFNTLMAFYGLSAVQFPANPAKTNANTRLLGASAQSPENIRLIQSHYHKDFDLFEYDFNVPIIGPRHAMSASVARGGAGGR